MSLFSLPLDVTPTPIMAQYNASYSWVTIVIYALFVIALWRMFTKAGRPGWAAIIPIYNIYVVVKLAGYSGWLVILLFIPIVDIVVGIMVAIRLAKAFGHGGAFGFFLLFVFSIIGYYILGFGDSKFVGPGGRAVAAATGA
jgi:Family of unknown function (DUF5684)